MTTTIKIEPDDFESEDMLFVGGPWDGRRMSCPSGRRVLYAGPPHDPTAYHIHRLRDQDGATVRVYVADDVRHVVARLVQHYRPAAPEPRQ